MMEHNGHQSGQSRPEGLRERKRRDTLQRITQTGLDLFVSNGYEETTLDEIAAAAGISRRTFFHYFKSKDEILLAWQSAVADSIHSAVLMEPTHQSPIDALCGALLKMVAHFDKGAAIDVARILQSNEQLRAANQAKFVRMEQAAFGALCALWPQQGRRARLRLVAMVGLGAFRLAIEQWTEEGGKVRLTKRIEQTFANLRAELERGQSNAG
jgi:AcrR family transcriptional regulator